MNSFFTFLKADFLRKVDFDGLYPEKRKKLSWKWGNRFFGENL